jgi:hypothetical protein
MVSADFQSHVAYLRKITFYLKYLYHVSVVFLLNPLSEIIKCAMFIQRYLFIDSAQVPEKKLRVYVSIISSFIYFYYEFYSIF